MFCRSCQTEKEESCFEKYGDQKQYTRKDCKQCYLKIQNGYKDIRYQKKLELKREKTKEENEQIKDFVELLRKQGKISKKIIN